MKFFVLALYSGFPKIFFKIHVSWIVNKKAQTLINVISLPQANQDILRVDAEESDESRAKIDQKIRDTNKFTKKFNLNIL